MKNPFFNLSVSGIGARVASQVATNLASRLVLRPDFSIQLTSPANVVAVDENDKTAIRIDVLLHINDDLRAELLSAFRTVMMAGKLAITQRHSIARLLRQMPQLRLDVLLHLNAESFPSRLLSTVPAFRRQPISPHHQAPARNGIWVERNKHGVVIARGAYLHNNKHGLWREYYDTGELMLEEHYLQGVAHGRFATFHPNGQCCSEGRYEHGLRQGPFCMFDESGCHMRTLEFDRDKLIHDLNVDGVLAIA